MELIGIRVWQKVVMCGKQKKAKLLMYKYLLPALDPGIERYGATPVLRRSLWTAYHWKGAPAVRFEK